MRHATYVLTGDVFLKKEKLSCLMMAAVNVFVLEVK
jgi:hypothetical protein